MKKRQTFLYKETITKKKEKVKIIIKAAKAADAYEVGIKAHEQLLRRKPQVSKRSGSGSEPLEIVASRLAVAEHCREPHNRISTSSSAKP